MPFNLDTYDETGRDLNQHNLTETHTTTSTIQIMTADPISQAVIEHRLMQFIHNLGDSVTIDVRIHTTTLKKIDNLDF